MNSRNYIMTYRFCGVNIDKISKFILMSNMNLFEIHQIISTCNKDKEKLPIRPYTILTYQIKTIY